ncbi:MAG: ATPase, T2SS/T4P/T4SS family [Rhodothermales bacterium]|nr:ATPase, T2SS/T4P/T4SS family [Rhodothermales bacterium]
MGPGSAQRSQAGVPPRPNGLGPRPNGGVTTRDRGGFPEFARSLARSAPSAMMGEDRLRYYAEHINRLSEDQREVLTRYINGFVARMHEMGASDLDIGGPATGGRAWYRVDGDKKPYVDTGMTNHELDVLLLHMAGEARQPDLFATRALDFSYVLQTGQSERRFRATMYFDLQHLGLCLRAIAENVRPLRSLGFHPAIERGLQFQFVRDGLTLVTGVTGSGKSTTLDSVIDANNDGFHGHVVIIAKPIEYMHSPKKCLTRHREVGQDVPSFKDGIVQALRQDPDIIVVGEMRDPMTISAALEAADSGHKVFSTLHTSSAVESLDRIVAEYPPEEQDRVRGRLADVLRCVISQKLLPRLGGGRILCKEVLWVTPSVRAAIKSKNTGEIYQMIWEGSKLGMTTLEQDLVRLLRERQISPETAINFANNKRRLQQLLQ